MAFVKRALMEDLQKLGSFQKKLTESLRVVERGEQQAKILERFEAAESDAAIAVSEANDVS